MEAKKLLFANILIVGFCTLSAQVNVNKFTGDFSYTVPLTTLPHPSGNNLDIQATYGSDVKVEQDAGPVGLGWGLNIYGFISRQVSGAPDDWNGVSAMLHGDTALEDHTGILHGHGEGVSNDIFQSTFRLDTLVEKSNMFLFPDYDLYQVVGYNMNGEIKPIVLDYKLINFSPPDGGTINYTNKAHFYYPDDFHDSLNLRYADWRMGPLDSINVNTSDTFYSEKPGYLIESSKLDYDGTGIHDSLYYQEANRKRLHTSRYIEYFTNQEIKDHNYGDDTTDIDGGFLEYKTGLTRSVANGFEANEIGAFRITDENGYSYHYSRPLLVKSETHGSYDLRNDYSTFNYVDTIRDTLILLDSTSLGSNGDYKIQNDTNRILWQYHSTKTYAYKWLLTGITGVDYADTNNNGIIDADDLGYWVKFNHSTYDYEERTPYLGHELGYSASYNHEYENNEILPFDHPKKLTQKLGRFSRIKRETYTLDSIETSTHRLIPTHFTRDDAREAITNYEEKGTKGTLSSTYKKGISTLKVVDIKSQSVVSKVKFIQDYSLARGFYQNKNNTLDTSDKYYSPQEVLNSISYNSSCTNCGKLTLNEIEIYGTQNKKVQPDYLFDYNASSSTLNPDYNPLKQDYWGNYKNSTELKGLSGYATNNSDSKAWHLAKITEPIGREIEIDYETDTYEKVLDESFDAGTRGAIRIFAIKEAIMDTSNAGKYWDIVLQNGESDYKNFVNLSDSLNGNYSSIIPFTWRDSTCMYCNMGSMYEFDTKPKIEVFKSHLIHSSAVSNLDTIGDQSITNYISYPGNSGTNLFPLNKEIDAICYDPDSAYCNIHGYTYSGRGYVSFYLPQGSKLYGGGTRVSKITTKNGTTESYESSYEYYEGVATSELDPYYKPLNIYDGDTILYYQGLMSNMYHKFQLSPMVGYSRVEQTNLGDNDESLGKIENTFFTNPLKKQYYRPHISSEDSLFDFGNTYKSQTLEDGMEYVDKFSSFWGLPVASTVYDKGNRIISQTSYEYQSSIHGTVPEGFCSKFVQSGFGGGGYNHDIWFFYATRYYPPDVIPPAIANPTDASNWSFYGLANQGEVESYTLNLLRKYPARLKKIYSYDQGVYSESEVGKYNRITSDWHLVRSLDDNGNNNTLVSTKAFEAPGNFDLGPKCDNYHNRNVLNHSYTSYSYPDSNISGGDLGSVQKNIYSDFCEVRKYNASSARYKSEEEHTPHFNKLTFEWRGALSEYGLFEDSLFKDFHQTRVIDPTWLSGYATTNGFTLAKDEYNWISIGPGTPLGPYDFNNLTFAIYNRDEFNEIYVNTTIDQNILLFDNDDFLRNIEFREEEWTLFEDKRLETSNGNMYVYVLDPVPADWKKTSEVTLVNPQNKVLESINENKRYSAKKYRVDGHIPYVSGFNTNFISFTSSSFEDEVIHSSSYYSEGEVFFDGDRQKSGSAHAGEYLLNLTQGEVAKYVINDSEDFQSGQTYRASVWVKDTLTSDLELKIYTSNLSGGDISSSVLSNNSNNITVGDWVLMNVDLYLPESLGSATVTAEIKGSTDGGKVDDFRFHPLNSQVGCTIIDPVTRQKIAELGPNNLATTYIYNNRDQLIEIWKDVPEKGRKKVQEFSQNFARSY